MLHHMNFIKNASSIKSESEKKIADGIVRGTLNEYQKNSVDGLLKGGMPHHSSSASHQSGSHPNVKASGKAPETEVMNGAVPVGGTKMVKRKD